MAFMSRSLKFVDQVSFLAEEGTLDFLRALSYFRGKRGVLGYGAREVVFRGMEEIKRSLTDAERKRFNEILASVKVASSLKSDQ